MSSETKLLLEDCTYANGCIPGTDCEGCAVEVTIMMVMFMIMIMIAMVMVTMLMVMVMIMIMIMIMIANVIIIDRLIVACIIIKP